MALDKGALEQGGHVEGERLSGLLELGLTHRAVREHCPPCASGMYSAVCCVHVSLSGVQCSCFIVQCALCIVYCAVCCVQCAFVIVQFALCSVQCSV